MTKRKIAVRHLGLKAEGERVAVELLSRLEGPGPRITDDAVQIRLAALSHAVQCMERGEYREVALAAERFEAFLVRGVSL